MLWIKKIHDWLGHEERSAAYLARKARMDGTYIYSLLSGAKTPGHRVLARLEAAMGMEQGDLVALYEADRQREAMEAHGNP